MASLLELNGVGLRLGERHVLDRVNLALAEGEVHALLGANGSGKSSLAYAVMGCEAYRPTAGSIRFAGEGVDAMPMHERARRGIALAWQEPARFEGLTVGDFLAIGLAPGTDPTACLQAVGLDAAEYLRRGLDRTLSGGERKRVELAGILARRPRLAILDEPTAGIDLLSIEGVLDILERLRADGAAVLLISHQEGAAIRADRASQLCGGRIVSQGTVAAVVENFKARRCRRCDGEVCGRV